MRWADEGIGEEQGGVSQRGWDGRRGTRGGR